MSSEVAVYAHVCAHEDAPVYAHVYAHDFAQPNRRACATRMVTCHK